MSVKAMSPWRNRSTASSSAADRPTIAPRSPERAVSSTTAKQAYRRRSISPKWSVRWALQSNRGAGDGARSHSSAYWIGRRMSGSASCAFTLPSTYSTIAWTMLSGW